MTSYGLYAPEFNIWPIYGGNRGWGIFSFVLGSSGGYIGTDVATRFIPSDLIGFYNLNIIQNLSFSYGSGIGTLYKNGVFFKSKSMTAPGYVGQLKTYTLFSNPTYAAGNLYNTQFYNRALSASEILQNFNATRSRFGI